MKSPEPYYYQHENSIPLPVLENALKIAQRNEDIANLHYLIAVALMRSGDPVLQQKAADEFDSAIQTGKGSDWYDDALYQYAQWLSTRGRPFLNDKGQWIYEPDFPTALSLYQRITREFSKGQTRYYDDAMAQIKAITSPSVGVNVSNIFLPGSEIQYYLSWRNLKQVQMSIYSVNLTQDIAFQKDSNSGNWIQQIQTSGKSPLKSWVKQTEDKGKYLPGQETLRLDSKLEPGAYVIEAKGADVNARDLILVSDASLVLKVSGTKALGYFCSTANGAPVAGATIHLWEQYYENNIYQWKSSTKQTNQDGLALFDLYKRESNQVFAAAQLNQRQAFSSGYSYNRGDAEQDWRIYAFTDRPAYRPDETVQWKFIARQHKDFVYSTPSNQTIEFEIKDPQGSVLKSDKVKLNAFGSATGSLDLKKEMPLGEYQIQFWNEGRTKTIGYAVLFRLEEYKLPEFKVSIQTPEENGKKKIFRVGDKVEVTVQADYYFGGPVSDAQLEVVVYQNIFYRLWEPPQDYPWLYRDMISRSQPDYGGQEIVNKTLKTDPTGKATFTFDTPRNSQQDFVYRVEARVTDSSRREITATDTVRVTRQSYYVYPRPEHNLYRPQDKVTINIKAVDANDDPVVAEGKVTLSRAKWTEVWLDSKGSEISGDSLRKIRSESKIFPPPPEDGCIPWRPIFQGYKYEELLTRTVKTDAKGVAQFEFTPESDGYYQVAWVSQEKGSIPIQAQTTVWVATNATTELGYRSGGVEIIVDKDTVRAGQTAPVMLSAIAPDRYVLFSTETEDLLSYQLVHMDGNVKLIQMQIKEELEPNFFLSAAMVSDQQIYMDQKEIVVPPVEHFLQVEVKPDREQYQPQEQGTISLTTRDVDGNPVSAEVALGLVDESVYYIQPDLAPDPREFFYGQKRYQSVQTQSTFQFRSYTKLDRQDKSNLQGGIRGDKVEGVFSDEERFELDALGYASNARELSMNPNAPPSPAVAGAMQKASKDDRQAESMMVAEQSPEQPVVQVRSDFRSTVLWQPDIVTDANGTARVTVKYPDSLTTWKATARVATTGNKFGIGSSTTRTKLPLIVRLQAPRFFVVGDLVTISAVINNNTDAPLSVAPKINAEGLVVSGLVVNGKVVKGESSNVSVPPNGEGRMDWAVSVQKAGEAKIQVTAQGGKYSDAMEKTYTVYEHGIEKLVAKSGKMRGSEVLVTLNIPQERKPESTQLMIQVTPSMAVTMLDALPYLIDYPYGCTEQTMSRFLPAVITAKTLSDLKIGKPAQSYGGIVEEYINKTHPKGKKDIGKLEDMVDEGLKRLYDFQHSDGGWGWWKDGESDSWMTAYVVWGMSLAQNAGVEVRRDAIDKGANFLRQHLVNAELQFDSQAWMLHAVTESSKGRSASEFETKAFENLWKNRDQLNAYTRALLAISANNMGLKEQANVLIRNLENGVKIDEKPDSSIILGGSQDSSDTVMATAHWGADGFYWRWSESPVETTSTALRALLAIDPQNKLVEPVTNWLIKNRRGAQWSSTRDTAITVLALNDYLRKSGELKTQLQYELFVNGNSIATKTVTSEDIFGAPSQYFVDRKYIKDGNNEIRVVRKSGEGPLYFSAQAEYFSLEEPIPAAGNEIFVKRQYFKLVARPTLLTGFVYDRVPLDDGGSVASGDRVETVITIEAKNDYEYLVFEDMKPAGFEAVEVRSGEPLYAQESTKDGRQRWVYQEFRDRKIALFIDKLPQGIWEIRYSVRAETPGQFHALPAVGYAMYVPEIRTNGTELRITVLDK